MNCDKELVLVYLEEDNITRAYFRVRPLLTMSGDAQEEAARLWPDHGCLRIVPDRNEQHVFKDRMRAIAPYCVMDLTHVQPEANKIRTNKNYHPDRGEFNQFILYSDTVRSLPEHSFFQVLDGKTEDFAQLADASITPLFFIREEGALHGPVRKGAPEKPEPAEGSVEPIYEIACPDGQTRRILCRETPLAAPAAPLHEEEPLPIGKPLEILDSSRGFEETLQDIAQPLSEGANLLRSTPESVTPPVTRPAPMTGTPLSSAPLSGTPLYRAPLHTSVPQPKNKLQEVVSSQWRIARNDPPADPLPAGASMSAVENPVETACQHVRKAWQMPESRAQLVDFLCSLEGMRSHLTPSLCGSGATPLQKVLSSRLQDLEAERLTALVQLDKAKADMEDFRRQTAEKLTAKAREEIDSAEKTLAAIQERVEAMKLQLNTLTQQRDGLLSKVDELTHQALPEAIARALTDASVTAPVSGIPLRMTSVSGEKAELNELIARLQSAGAELNKNACVALLILLADAPRIGLAAPSTAAASTWVGNAVRALGWQSGYAVRVSPEQTPLAAQRPEDGTPQVLLSTQVGCAPMAGVTRLLLASEAPSDAAYAVDPWPVYPLDVAGFIEEKDAAGSPVSAASLIALMDAPAIPEKDYHAVMDPILAVAPPLSGAAEKALRRFVAAASAVMEGGLPAALDWALVLWVVPAAQGHAEAAQKLLPLLAEYPMAHTKLS